jgi:Domain of unknown function (DUF397)
MTDRIILVSAALNGRRKSSYSNTDGGSCVEVGDNHPSGVPVRDSKASHGPALVFSAAGWASFITALKGGIRPLP